MATTAIGEELESLGKVMALYEEMGGDDNPELADFVQVSRKWVRTEQVALREAPFAESKRVPHRMHLFRDLVVFADGKRVAHYLNLGQCTVKEVTKEDGGQWGMVFTVVTRLRMAPDGSLHSQQQADADGSHYGRIVTRIEKFEVWVPAKEMRDDVVDEIHHSQDELEQEEEAAIRRSDSTASVSATSEAGGASDDPHAPPRKQRSWAAKRGTLKARKSGVLSVGGGDEAQAAAAEAGNGLSLADLEARYSIKLKAANAATAAAASSSSSSASASATTNADGAHDASGERVEFDVEFGEGPMGFSLGSGKGVGVIVGRLAANSFAEIAGVCIGDRITWLGHSVEGIEVGVDTTWQECVDKLKALPRPLVIRFERTAARQVDPDKHPEAHHPSASAATSAPASAAAASPTSPAAAPETRESSDTIDGTKKRAWANRRAQRAAAAGGGMVNLHELERVYKEAASDGAKDVHDLVSLFDRVECKTPQEKACVMVLKEIFQTESAYVSDLRALVGEYIIPLRRAVRRGKCRDLENGSKFCEHNLIRSTCTRSSTEAHAILDAENMKGIFCNTETIMTINSELLRELTRGMEALAKRGSALHLADVAGVFGPAFQRITPFFKMYAVYCHNYYSAVDRLAFARTHNQELHEFLTQKEDKSEHVTLPSLIIKPVQRICKYPLLFETLLKELKKGDAAEEHVAELHKAAEVVSTIAESVNRSVGESDTMEQMLHVFEELGGEKGAPGLMAAHRRFVRTDDVAFVDVTDKSGELPRVLYLFNDALIVAKANPSGGSSNTLTKKMSLHKLSRNLTGSRKTLGSDAKQAHHGIAKLEKMLEVEQMTVTPLDGTNNRFGISIKYVSHHMEEAQKRRTLTRSKTPNNSGKVVTVIEKFEVWMSSKDDRDSLFSDLSKQIETRESLTDGQRRAEMEVGAPRKQHSWARRHKDSGAGVDAKALLAQKYASKS